MAIALGVYLYCINWNRMKAVAAYEGLTIGMYLDLTAANMGDKDHQVFDLDDGRHVVQVLFNEECYLFVYVDRHSRVFGKIVGDIHHHELNCVERMLQSLGLYQARLFRKQPDTIDYAYCPN